MRIRRRHCGNAGGGVGVPDGSFGLDCYGQRIAHRPGWKDTPYPCGLPVVRAENKETLIDRPDRKYGGLVAGGVRSGKTSVLWRLLAGDVWDRAAAPIVWDFKPELAILALWLTPPQCGKRLWYLDLGHPALGMSPLRVFGDGPFWVEIDRIANNMIMSLLDMAPGQIYTSSERYLKHSTIGALALARELERPARFEDIHALLRPARDDLRQAAAEACATYPDLDFTAEYLRSGLKEDLQIAASHFAGKLDPPANKIENLLTSPSLRRFFNHPVEVPLREMIDARDLLVVNPNMGMIGEPNAVTCTHFMLRMLNTELQRLSQLPRSEIPRVPLFVDEAQYILNESELAVNQFATYAVAGIEPMVGIHFLSQLGAGSPVARKIRDGVLTLLQALYLFRMSNLRDAEEAAQLATDAYSASGLADAQAMAGYMRYLRSHYCMVSQIAKDAREPAYTGETYPYPDLELVQPVWRDRHLERQAERCGEYPELLDSTLLPATVPAAPDDERAEAEPGASADQRPGSCPGRSRPTPAPAQDTGETGETEPLPVAGPADASERPGRREARVYHHPPDPAARLERSPARRVAGRRATGQSRRAADAGEPVLGDLSVAERICEISEPQASPPAGELPRMYAEDYRVLVFLDRAGLAPGWLIGRAVMPANSSRAVRDKLRKLHETGLIARHETGLRGQRSDPQRPPVLFSLTGAGLQAAQQRRPPAISPKRELHQPGAGNGERLAHDLHALAWTVALHRTVGDLAGDDWKTPRYAAGRIPVPRAGSGRERRPVEISDIRVPERQMIADLALKTRFGRWSRTSRSS